MATTVAVQAAQQAPQTPPKAQVDINVDRNGGGRWYASPVWIAIGVLAPEHPPIATYRVAIGRASFRHIDPR